MLAGLIGECRCVCVVVTWRQGGGGGSGGTNRKRRAMGRIACLPPVSSRFLYLSICLSFFFFGVDSFNPYRASVGDLSLDRDLCPGPHHQRSTLPATHKRWRIAIRQPQPHTEVATSFLTCCFFHFDINELPLFVWRHFHRDCCAQHLWRSSSLLSHGVWGYSQRPGQRSSSQTKTVWPAIHHRGR